MKYLSLIISLSLFFLFTDQLQAQHDHSQHKPGSEVKNTAEAASGLTETFVVYGNCGMCKRTIEKAAKSVAGVQSAIWDSETDMITVQYDAAKAKLGDIKKAIAASGYDTDAFRAPDEAYNGLPGCCQYDRPEKAQAETATTATSAITETFTVYGNCGMCKRTIEKAAKGVDGVQSATWDADAAKVTVTYDSGKVKLETIKKAIAASGYDTDAFRASDDAYKALPGCCQYDRPEN
ncbi:MAG: heavy-metal-associated domain-containing protein [Saprospiraceae bacterium]